MKQTTTIIKTPYDKGFLTGSDRSGMSGYECPLNEADARAWRAGWSAGDKAMREEREILCYGSEEETP